MELNIESLQLHQIAWIIGGICGFAACVISLFTIVRHLQNYSNPRIQVFIVRIILMIPIYTIDSYLSLLFKNFAIYFDLARDCYEAYVLYMFFRLLVELADGEEMMILKMNEVKQIRYVLPLCCFHVKPGRIFLHRCKQMILQYVVVKPLLDGISFILQLAGEYDDGDYSLTGSYLYISVVYNLSITITLYFLVLFYEATKDILKPFKPLTKFICIKAIIFFSFWQSVAISGMVYFNILIQQRGDWTVNDVATGLQSFLICVEMFPLSIAFMKTFGYRDFKDPGMFLSDNRNLIQNFVQVANMKDVFSDTIVSLKKGPKRHVEVDDFLDIPRDAQLKRVVKQGWLEKRGEDLAKIWKNRYFLLLSRPKGLAYFKGNPFTGERKKIEDVNGRLKVRGFIELATVKEISSKNESGFIIVTALRTWKFRCNTPKERDEWLFALSSVVPVLNSPKTLTTLEDSNEFPTVQLDLS